jgi:hypothetical protein
MSAATCTRARSLLGLRARPPLRLRAAAPVRPGWRGMDAGAMHDRARILPPCGAEQAAADAG